MKSPIANKKPHKTKIHNTERIDNYHWMRLTDKQKNAKTKDKATKDVLNYIKEENNFTRYHLKSVNNLQNKIYPEGRSTQGKPGTKVRRKR